MNALIIFGFVQIAQNPHEMHFFFFFFFFNKEINKRWNACKSRRYTTNGFASTFSEANFLVATLRRQSFEKTCYFSFFCNLTILQNSTVINLILCLISTWVENLFTAYHVFLFVMHKKKFLVSMQWAQATRAE